MKWWVMAFCIFALLGCEPEEKEPEVQCEEEGYIRGEASPQPSQAVSQPLEIEKVKPLVEEWNKEGKDWHFHRLHPNCFLNQNQATWAIFLENVTDQDFYLVSTNQPDDSVKDLLFYLFEAASARTPGIPGMGP